MKSTLLLGQKLSRQVEEQRRMKNCAEELGNPRNRSKDGGERKFTTADLLRRDAANSGPFQVDAAACVDEALKGRGWRRSFRTGAS